MMLLPGTPEIKLHSDEELVKLSQEGAEDAFAELIRRNYSSAFKLALSILRERQEAEDEIQNAFWKAFQHIGQFQQDSKFSTWVDADCRKPMPDALAPNAARTLPVFG